MKKSLITLWLIFCVIAHHIEAQKILPKTIIIKLKSNKSVITEKYWAEKYNVEIISFKKKFSNIAPLQKERDRFGHKMIDLSLVYELKLKNAGNEQKLAFLISKDPIVEYAEPYYLPEIFYVPNDENISSQYALDAIRAYEAWDIFQGDTTVVVGIVDMGIDLSHEDLQNKIAYNYNDSVDGIDNDNDGYVDNFYGWDLGDNDYNTQWNQEGTEGELQHGVWVSGAGFAETDNSVGIASPGFNVRFLPIKISDRNGALVKSYEGIIYAAQHGCKIINCSWGSTFYSNFANDVIDYVTYTFGSLVVAAAGNYGNSVPFYPASYHNAMSVAGTGPTNEKWGNSSYGIYVDVCAPADNILTTWSGNNYSGTWGTSFAAPQTAALAALLLEYYGDTLNPWQIRLIIRNTAKNIDTVGSNVNYSGFLGKGLIDMYASLTENFKPGIFAENIFVNTSHHNIDSSLYAGDTIYFSIKITNYLSSTEDLFVKISSDNQYITIVDSLFYVGHLGQYQQLTTGFVFSAVINEDIGFDKLVDFKFVFYDSTKNYSDFVYKRLTVNPSYLNIAPNNIRTTLTSYGKNGFNNLAPTQGIGFMFKDYQESLFYESGYIIAVPGKVCDAVRGEKDFDAITKTDSLPCEETIHHFVSVFDDSRADTNRLGFKIIQEVYGFDTPSLYNSLLYKISIINDTIVNYDSLFFGIFTDWDIYDFAHNFSDFDVERKLGYTYYDGQEKIYAGIKFFGDNNVHCYSFDNISNAENQIVIADGYSKEEKFLSLILDRYQAGGNSGYDVAQTVSTGPFNLMAGDTLNIWFAYIAANSLSELFNEADSLNTLFDELTQYVTQQSKTQVMIYPNPSSNVIFVKGNFSKAFVYDINGKLFKITEKNIIDISDLPQNTYILKIELFDGNYRIFKFVKKN